MWSDLSGEDGGPVGGDAGGEDGGGLPPAHLPPGLRGRGECTAKAKKRQKWHQNKCKYKVGNLVTVMEAEQSGRRARRGSTSSTCAS